jgi:hypothetical protein
LKKEKINWRKGKTNVKKSIGGIDKKIKICYIYV